MNKKDSAFKSDDGFYRPTKLARIFTIHGMSDLDYGAHSRTFGYFETLKEAQNIVLSNGGDIYEQEFDYIVIEQYIPGIYVIPKYEWWYRWNFKKQRYMTIDKPACFTRTMKVVGFGL